MHACFNNACFNNAAEFSFSTVRLPKPDFARGAFVWLMHHHDIVEFCYAWRNEKKIHNNIEICQHIVYIAKGNHH